MSQASLRGARRGRSIASTIDGRRYLSRIAAAVRDLFAPTLAAAGQIFSAHHAPQSEPWTPATALYQMPAAQPPLAEAGGQIGASAGADAGGRFQVLDSDSAGGCGGFDTAAAAAAAVGGDWRGNIGDVDALPPTRTLDPSLRSRFCCPCEIAAAGERGGGGRGSGGGGEGRQELGADSEGGCCELDGGREDREEGWGGRYDGELGGSFCDDGMVGGLKGLA